MRRCIAKVAVGFLQFLRPYFPTSTRRAFFSLFLSLWSVAATAQAQDSHSTHPSANADVVYLGLTDAMRQGARRGPEVTLASSRRAAAREAVAAANPILSQLPVVQGQVGPRLSGGAVLPEVIVGLSQPIPITNVGRAQENLARAEAKVVQEDIQLARLDAAESAGVAWVELALLDRILELRREAVAACKMYLSIVERRTRIGETAPFELSLAQSECASVETQVLEAEGRHFEAASRLALQVGLPPTARAEAHPGSLLSLDAGLDETAAAQVKSAEHPAVQSAAARATASKEAIDYAKSQQVPALSFGVQYQREGTGDQIVTAMFAVPLPLWRPWRYQQARQRAQYDEDLARLSVTRRAWEQGLELARHERDHAIYQYRHLRDRALPPARDALRFATKQFEAGEQSFVQVTWAQRTFLATAENVAVALAQVHKADLTYKKMTGALESEL